MLVSLHAAQQSRGCEQLRGPTDFARHSGAKPSGACTRRPHESPHRSGAERPCTYLRKRRALCARRQQGTSAAPTCLDPARLDLWATFYEVGRRASPLL
jgi:hypothetical protein